MATLTLTVLDKEYAIHRLHPDANIPESIFISEFYSISRTDEELSIVCEADIFFERAKTNTGWSCIKVMGPLDFGLTGILADISNTLANANVSIFAISTFDTDYILVKHDRIAEALSALKTSGYEIR